MAPGEREQERVTDFRLQPIGWVLSAYHSFDEIPPQGGPAEIELLPELLPGLTGIENSSHLIVLAFLHQADRRTLQSLPRKFDPESPERGVFATRSPARPNPLSLTVVRLLSRDGCRLTVDGLDLLDGTPVVDLKPYCPAVDSVPAARHQRRCRQDLLPPEELAACLDRELENGLGQGAGAPEARLAVEAVLRLCRRLGVDPRSPELSLLVSRPGPLAEGLAALTGATGLSGRLRVDVTPGPPTIFFVHPAGHLRLVARQVTAPPGGDPMAPGTGLWVLEEEPTASLAAPGEPSR